jgi:large subunit ribosomal protein L7/L12
MADEQKKEEVKTNTPAEKPAEEVKVELKPEEKTEETKKDKPAPSGKFKDLIKQIEELSVLELSQLVKELEDRFGVSASMPMAMAAAPAEGVEAGAAGADEKAMYTVHLAASGDQKINVIKALREITGLGLKDAKDMADAAPKDVKADVPKEEAENMKKMLEEAGATVELK